MSRITVARESGLALCVAAFRQYHLSPQLASVKTENRWGAHCRSQRACDKVIREMLSFVPPSGLLIADEIHEFLDSAKAGRDFGSIQIIGSAELSCLQQVNFSFHISDVFVAGSLQPCHLPGVVLASGECICRVQDFRRRVPEYYLGARVTSSPRPHVRFQTMDQVGMGLHFPQRDLHPPLVIRSLEQSDAGENETSSRQGNDCDQAEQ
jgi:hypothetical protein